MSWACHAQRVFESCVPTNNLLPVHCSKGLSAFGTHDSLRSLCVAPMAIRLFSSPIRRRVSTPRARHLIFTGLPVAMLFTSASTIFTEFAALSSVTTVGF